MLWIIATLVLLLGVGIAVWGLLCAGDIMGPNPTREAFKAMKALEEGKSYDFDRHLYQMKGEYRLDSPEPMAMLQWGFALIAVAVILFIVALVVHFIM